MTGLSCTDWRGVVVWCCGLSHLKWLWVVALWGPLTCLEGWMCVFPFNWKFKKMQIWAFPLKQGYSNQGSQIPSPADLPISFTWEPGMKPLADQKSLFGRLALNCRSRDVELAPWRKWNHWPGVPPCPMFTNFHRNRKSPPGLSANQLRSNKYIHIAF